VGLGRVKTQAPATRIEYFGRIALHESQITLRTKWSDIALENYIF
jgi:hypothetical protein